MNSSSRDHDLTDQRQAETEKTWNNMDTAPRDGTAVLIAFGSDHASSAIYVDDPTDAHPWKFIDLQNGKPMLNGARDDKYGPTGWLPIPPWKSPVSPKSECKPGTPMESTFGPWRVWFDPPPIGARNCDWHYQHEDADGESPGWMYGHCASRDECIAEIIDGYEDRQQ